jgi:PAS domain S-box-containing protein
MNTRDAASGSPSVGNDRRAGASGGGTPPRPNPAELDQLMKALRESEERYRKLVELSPDGIYVHRDGLLLFINPAAAALFGRDREELIGKSILDLVPPGMHEEVAERLRAAREAGGEPLHQTTRFLRSDGSETWIEGFSVPITFGGEPARQAVIWDITERVRTEEELRRSRQELRRLAAHLQSVREEEQVRIAREIHDELGQSLTALKLDLAWVRRRLGERGREGAHEALEEALEERLAAMSELVDGTLSSMRRLALELRPGVLDDLGLEAAAEWQIDEFRQRTGAVCEYHADLGRLEIDQEVATATYRILQESLTNVARHAEAGHVEVTLRANQEGLWLEVRDDGRGFDPSRMRETSSLGLLTMYERARACGGRFDVRSTPGEGTTVSLHVPEPRQRPRRRRRP